MADSLDDFFAKKDKKRKNKTQTAALSAGALVKELEEGAKQSEYSSRRDGKTSAAMELLGLNANDNDWKDFEEVEKRDYTGLKVKEMSIQDQDDEQRRLTEQSEQVPETVPWRSKQDTVAAIISARNESNLPASDLAEGEEPADGTTPDSTTATTAPTTAATALTSTSSSTPTAAELVKANMAAAVAGTDPKSSNLDNTDSDATKETQTKDAAAEKVDESPKPAEATATATAAAAAGSDSNANKDGDSKPAAIVKKIYRPPGSRLEPDTIELAPMKMGAMSSETKVLEPMKMSQAARSSGPRRFGVGAKLDLDSTRDFPSLG